MPRLHTPSRMKLVGMSLPEQYLAGLDELVYAGHYSSRAEAIRVAIKNKLDSVGKLEYGKIPNAGRTPAQIIREKKERSELR